MAESKIEWTGRSDWNPVRGCTRVSPGCGGPGPHGGCYAEKIASRFSGPGLAFEGFAEKIKGNPHWTGRVELMRDRLTDPLKWRKPATIFAASMSDLFHEKLVIDHIASIFAVMVAAVHVRGHTFQVLTKRSERMRRFLNAQVFWDQVNAEAAGHAAKYPTAVIPRGAEVRLMPDKYGPGNPPPGIWLGVSVESQEYADARIPDLLGTPAAIRFLSCEPLLGPVKLWGYDEDEGALRGPGIVISGGMTVGTADNPPEGYDDSHPGIDWVIGGGESGPRARPWSIQWARELRDQCKAVDVPFFWKQNGEWRPAGSHRSEEPGKFAFGDYEHDRQTMIVTDHYPRQFTMFGARSVMERVGKKAAGALLDGVAHKEMPNA